MTGHKQDYLPKKVGIVKIIEIMGPKFEKIKALRPRSKFSLGIDLYKVVVNLLLDQLHPIELLLE
jgi:hypothetical protein